MGSEYVNTYVACVTVASFNTYVVVYVVYVAIILSRFIVLNMFVPSGFTAEFILIPVDARWMLSRI